METNATEIPIDMEFCSSESEMGIDIDKNEILKDCIEMKTEFTTNLALFYLKLQSKYLISEFKIQEIIAEFVSIHDFGQSIMKNTLLKKLQTVGLSMDQA